MNRSLNKMIIIKAKEAQDAIKSFKLDEVRNEL